MMDDGAVPHLMEYHGPLCVYFNKHDTERHWCVAPGFGSWELAITGLTFTGPGATVYHKKDTADEDDGIPSAYLTMYGKLFVYVNGTAHIEAR